MTSRITGIVKFPDFHPIGNEVAVSLDVVFGESLLALWVVMPEDK